MALTTATKNDATADPDLSPKITLLLHFFCSLHTSPPARIAWCGFTLIRKVLSVEDDRSGAAAGARTLEIVKQCSVETRVFCRGILPSGSVFRVVQ